MSVYLQINNTLIFERQLFFAQHIRSAGLDGLFQPKAFSLSVNSILLLIWISCFLPQETSFQEDRSHRFFSAQCVLGN